MSVLEQTTPATAEVAKKSWRDLVKIHPAAEMLPMMAEEELKELGEDIKANGLKQPIVFYDDGPGGGGISLLDGRNRLDAMVMVGYHVPLSHRDLRDPNKTLRAEGPDGERTLVHMRHEYKDLWGFAVSANIRRRHLTTEQKREIAAKLLQAQPGRSDRAIAKEVNLSPTTVGAIRETVQPASVQNGQLGQEPAKRVGRDGKVRKVPTKAAKAAPAEEQPPPATEPPKPAAEDAEIPPTGHTSNRPLLEIKVLARNEWQVKALENEPTNPEEATLRYNALSWELGEIEKRWHELETAEGRVLEDAKRFFPNGRGWQAWLKSHKTCRGTSAGVRIALSHAGYDADGRPKNTITRFNRWWDELCRDAGNNALLSELTGELDRLMEKHAGSDSSA